MDNKCQERNNKTPPNSIINIKDELTTKDKHPINNIPSEITRTFLKPTQKLNHALLQENLDIVSVIWNNIKDDEP